MKKKKRYKSAPPNLPYRFALGLPPRDYGITENTPDGPVRVYPEAVHLLYYQADDLRLLARAWYFSAGCPLGLSERNFRDWILWHATVEELRVMRGLAAAGVPAF